MSWSRAGQKPGKCMTKRHTGRFENKQILPFIQKHDYERCATFYILWQLGGGYQKSKSGWFLSPQFPLDRITGFLCANTNTVHAPGCPEIGLSPEQLAHVLFWNRNLL
jgi:hypothetical protein